MCQQPRTERFGIGDHQLLQLSARHSDTVKGPTDRVGKPSQGTRDLRCGFRRSSQHVGECL